MLKFNVTVDVSGVLRALDKLKREQREIARRTVNSLASEVRKTWQKEMSTKFSRPTRWPISGVWVTQATAANLTARIAMKDGPVKQAELLKQQFLGGGRAPKRLEVWLRQRGFLGAGDFIVPGKGAPLDACGNVKRSWQSAILQQLTSGASKPAKGRRKAAVSGVFWASGKQGLHRGAWAKGKDGRLTPLLLAVSVPQYRALIQLNPLAEKVVGEKRQAAYDAAFARVMGPSQ